jgi:hypothetical protein
MNADDKTYEKNIEVRSVIAGRNHGSMKPTDPLWIGTKLQRTPILMSLSDARSFASQLLNLCTIIEKERAEAKKITLADIKDGAVFYAGGTQWRKVIELHDMRFMVVDRTGTVHLKLTSADAVVAHAAEWDYRKEKQA